MMKQMYILAVKKALEKNDTNLISKKDDIYEFKYKFTRDSEKEKMNEKKSRISLIQTNINPYLKANKYIDDIKTQDNYLRPVNF